MKIEVSGPWILPPPSFSLHAFMPIKILRYSGRQFKAQLLLLLRHTEHTFHIETSSGTEREHNLQVRISS